MKWNGIEMSERQDRINEPEVFGLMSDNIIVSIHFRGRTAAISFINVSM